MPPRNPMAHTPMAHVQAMEARRAQQGGPRTAADVIRDRIKAREAGLSEPILGEERTDDGRIRGGDRTVARALDEEIAAATAKPEDRGR